MKKLDPKELQQGKPCHSKNGGPSVEVLRTKIRELKSDPVLLVVFREIGNHPRERVLPMDEFLKKYQRKKRKI